MKWYLSALNKLLFYSFLILGIIFFVFGIGRTSTWIILFFSFVVSVLLSFILEWRGFGKESRYELFINIGLWLNVLGEFVYYYSGATYYDKILHFSIGILITAIVYQYYLKSLRINKDVIFFTVLGLFAFFEIYEYLVTIFFNYPLMGVIHNGVQIMSPLDDTMVDLICGSIGSIIYLFFRKEKIGKRIKKLRKQNPFRRKHSAA